MKMHELTDLIAKEVGQSRSTWEARDKIITSWLREKAKAIVYEHWEGEDMLQRASRLLGLEGEQEEVIGGSGVYPKTLRSEPPKDKLGEKCPHVYESNCHGIEMIKDPNGKEWAIGGTNRAERWKFDPWCGKETPSVPKSLEEEFLSIFKIHNNQYGSAKEWRNVVIKELAFIARKYFEK